MSCFIIANLRFLPWGFPKILNNATNTNDMRKSRSNSLYDAIFELIKKSLSLRTCYIIICFDWISWLVEGKAIWLAFAKHEDRINFVFDIEAQLP